jgi:hypothetical protein
MKPRRRVIALLLAVVTIAVGARILWLDSNPSNLDPSGPDGPPTAETASALTRPDSITPPTPPPDPTRPPTPTFAPASLTPSPIPTPANQPAPSSTQPPEPTMTPTATATASPAPTEPAVPAPTASAPAESEYCGGAIAEIAALHKTDTPEIVLVSGIGDLTGWYLISVRREQCFDFPDGFNLDGSVSILSGDDARPNTDLELFWTARNVWNNSSDDDAELYDCASALVSRYDDGG